MMITKDEIKTKKMGILTGHVMRLIIPQIVSNPICPESNANIMHCETVPGLKNIVNSASASTSAIAQTKTTHLKNTLSMNRPAQADSTPTCATNKTGRTVRPAAMDLLASMAS